MGLLKIPPGLGPWFKENTPGFWEWLLFLETFITTKFVTQGDVTLFTAGKGLHMKSPNGSKFYVTITNAGAIIVTPE